MKAPEVLTLVGGHVRLVPLLEDHAAALSEAVTPGALWKLWYTNIPSPDEMAAEIQRRLSLQALGTMLPFTIIDAASGRPAGMTSYMEIDLANDRLEIGSTWYAEEVQRTPLNTEAKFLLLKHAFETLGCVAVELRTHFLNHQSRRAIERLGAKLDGILRHHRKLKNGTLRDTCVYSITFEEWATIRTHLLWQLEKPRPL